MSWFWPSLVKFSTKFYRHFSIHRIDLFLQFQLLTQSCWEDRFLVRVFDEGALRGGIRVNWKT